MEEETDSDSVDYGRIIAVVVVGGRLGHGRSSGRKRWTETGVRLAF